MTLFSTQLLALKNKDARAQCLAALACELTSEYRSKFDYVPIELYRLANTLDTVIRDVPHLEGKGKLLPRKGGFTILVDSELDYLTRRSVIAHELAHTIFYSRDKDVPRRDSSPTLEEEWFCTDLSRRLLVPEWILDDLGIKGCGSFSVVFSRMVNELRISELLAARLMMADYGLAEGTAAWYRRSGNSWRIEKGRAVASPGLSTDLRSRLHNRARIWLSNREPQKLRVVGRFLPGDEQAFVAVSHAFPFD